MRKLTPIQAIRKNCLDCMCGSSKEVKLCTIPDCPLYPYRFGHIPGFKPRNPQGCSLKEMKLVRKAKKKAKKVI